MRKERGERVDGEEEGRGKGKIGSGRREKDQV
jgi:hypothetical protein